MKRHFSVFEVVAGICLPAGGAMRTSHVFLQSVSLAGEYLDPAELCSICELCHVINTRKMSAVTVV